MKEGKHSVLVASSRLVDLAGAEITTIEISEAFRNLGWEVTVASFEISDYFLDELDSLDVEYIDLSSSNSSSIRAFDLAWIHHYVTAHRILTDPSFRLTKAVYSSLSHFDPLECPPLPCLNVSNYLVHSEENLGHFTENYPDLSSRVSVMNNSVLARYWQPKCTHNGNNLNRLAVVSNHPPKEIHELITLLKKDGLHVDLFGISGKQIRVTPELLREYDGVISIGKTAQYSIASETPIYCYDHFGGYGWITLDNFDHARKYNFSGRKGSQTLTADEIRSELYSGYSHTISQSPELSRKGKEYFVLEDNIKSVLDNLLAKEHHPISVTKSNIISRHSTIFTRLRREIIFRDNLISDLKDLLSKEKSNAIEQILYREKMIEQMKDQISDEKENANAQILYRDKMISELNQRLKAEKDNARAQILHRDELIRALQQKTDIARLLRISKIRSFFKKFLR